jgi:hypothetical protein
MFAQRGFSVAQAIAPQREALVAHCEHSNVGRGMPISESFTRPATASSARTRSSFCPAITRWRADSQVLNYGATPCASSR